MTSISEDQTLPLDLDGTSNVLSNSSQYNHYDSPNHIASSISSELEQPGTFANLTSAGRMSPHRTRTMKDQEIQLGEMKKENFGLKLRIYHLEEALRKKYGDTDKGWQMNIELQVQMENLKKELAEKDRLLMQTKSAIDHMTSQHEKELKKAAASGPKQEELEELEEKLAQKEAELREKEAELAETQREADDANNRLDEMEALNNRLASELRDKEVQLEHMDEELSNLQQALAQREAPQDKPPQRSSAVQTADPLADKLAEATAELESARAQLAGKERELGEAHESLAEKDRQLKEVELRLLSMTQEMAANAGNYAQQMKDKENEMEQCKAKLREAEERLREKEAELGDCARERDAERQRAREMEAQVRKLQPIIQDREREIQDLRDQLAEAERQLEDGDHNRDKELSDLRKKLSEARAKAREVEPELAARQREIKRLSDELQDKEDELRHLRSKIRDLEDALSQSRMSAHSADVERNEQTEALDRLQKELEALRKQLRQESSQHDLEGALAAKEAIIDLLRKELDDLRAKLSEADRKYHQLNVAKAAEIGVLQATIDDLMRQLEQLQRALQEREGEVGQLMGEKEALERELDRLKRDNKALRDQVTALQDELANQAAGLEQAEEAINELRRLLEKLQDQQPKVNSAELATLRGQLAAMELALKGKEAELESLMQTLGLKDRTIQELQQELKRLREERATAEERARDLENQKAQLENELSELQSQNRIHQLSLSDLQDRLTQAYAEREELARKLKQAEATLRDKDNAYQDIEAMYKQLNEELRRLQQQLKDLQDSPTHVTVTRHETVSTPAPPDKDASRNTTMIFGSLSEDLFLKILQRLQELYNEITAGRADSSVAASSLTAKLEHLTNLHRHLEDSLRDSQKESPNKSGASNTSYTTYYYMRGGERSSGEDEEGEEGIKGTSTPKVTPKSKKTSPQKEAEINALRAELEEMRRWNEALQARLDESRKTRHVGVGMEKGGDAQEEKERSSVPPEKYLELTREVDRLLEELEGEKERSRAENFQKQKELNAIQATLRATENKVRELEENLKAALLRDANTSTDHFQELERLVSELEDARAAIARLKGQLEGVQRNNASLKEQLDGAQGTIARLKGQLDYEGKENRKLREELSDISISSMERSPRKNDPGLASTSSLPNLFSSETPKAGSRTDSWTNTRTSPRGDRPDVSALKAKNEDITRLNVELQRKCHEQLLKTPPHSRPSSAGSAHWQARLREQEEVLRSEMMEKERVLLGQVRDAEARLLEKEGEWQAKLAKLQQEGVELERQLAEAMKSKQNLRVKVMEGTDTIQAKDEEILNLTRSLSKSQEKIRILEERIDQLLTEKNAVIHELEQTIHQLEWELKLSKESASRLRHSLHVLDGTGGGGEEMGGKRGGTAAEMQTLHETLDMLTQELTVSMEELQNLKQRHHNLGEQKTLLSSQLSSCQEQVRTLQSELEIYQQLLEELKKAASRREAGTQAGQDEEDGGSPLPRGRGVLDERVTQLLEEVAHLRDQLDGSIRGNNTLADQLKTKLGHTRQRETGITSDHSHKKSSVGSQHTTSFIHHKSNGIPPSKPKASSSPKLSPRSHRHADTDEFTGKGSNLDSSSSSSFYSHSSSSRLVNGGGEGGGASGRTPHHSHFSSYGFGDFETLETRLQKALDSPTLQGQDRTFLEQLLMYLRQQRRQLDESRRLLEQLERNHQQLFDEEGDGPGIPLSSHIPPHSGHTGPVPPSSSYVFHSSHHLPSSSYTQSSPSQTRHFTTTHTTSQTKSNTSTNYGTQTKPASGSSYGTTKSPGASPKFHSKPFSPSQATQTKSGASASFGVQTSQSGLTKGLSSSSNSPRGVATVGLVSRSGPVSNGPTGRGVASSTATRSGSATVDLPSLYEQLLQTHSSLVEARAALNQQKSNLH